MSSEQQKQSVSRGESRHDPGDRQECRKTTASLLDPPLRPHKLSKDMQGQKMRPRARRCGSCGRSLIEMINKLRDFGPGQPPYMLSQGLKQPCSVFP